MLYSYAVCRTDFFLGERLTVIATLITFPDMSLVVSPWLVRLCPSVVIIDFLWVRIGLILFSFIKSKF